MSTKAKGRIIILFFKAPFVIFHKIGNSLLEWNHEAFSAFTAKSSHKIHAVFCIDILATTAVSSISIAISSSRASNQTDISLFFINYFNII
jgi:hypothetical protein